MWDLQDYPYLVYLVHPVHRISVQTEPALSLSKGRRLRFLLRRPYFVARRSYSTFL